MSDLVNTLRSHLVSFATMDAAADRIEQLEAALPSDDDIKELMMRCFIKLNGDLPPIDTQVGELSALFDEVIAEHREKCSHRPRTGAGQMKKAHDELPEDNAAMWAELEKRADRIEALEAEVERWHRVAMEAGAITCSDGRHIYPRRERIEQLEAALREIRRGEGEYSNDPDVDPFNVIENMKAIARAALDQSSPPARQENDDVFKGFRGNNEA